MALDLDATFGAVADTLINDVFATPIVYIRSLGTSYDPATGEVVEQTEEYSINAGIEQIELTEEGGTSESRLIKLYIEHSVKGMPHEASTGDRIEYKSRRWKVTQVNPAFVSKGNIASYIIARAD